MSEQLATREQPQILSLLQSDKVREEMALVVPPELKVESLLSKARLAILNNPDLLKCTPQSVLMAVKKSAACGLELNGRDCHLVPYGQTAQFLIDVKGYMKLGLESGLRVITHDLVYENDTFRIWTDDSGRHLLHSIDHRQTRGKVLGAYSYVQNASGAFDYEYMTLSEIDAIKARSRSSSGPWKTDENEMRRKTVVRRHSKRWPIGSKLAQQWSAVWSEDDDRLEQARPVKARLLPDEVVPAASLPEPERANLLPAASTTTDLEASGEDKF